MRDALEGLRDFQQLRSIRPAKFNSVVASTRTRTPVTVTAAYPNKLTFRV